MTKAAAKKPAAVTKASNPIAMKAAVPKAASKKSTSSSAAASKKAKTTIVAKAKSVSVPAMKTTKAAAPAAPNVFYTLSCETTWSKWGNSGSNGVVECNKTFATKEEACKYAPKLLSYYESDSEGFQDDYRSGFEDDYRNDPPDNGVLLRMENDCELETVSIENHVVPSGAGGSSSSNSSSAAAKGSAKPSSFYKLSKETHWCSGWGKSGVNRSNCDKIFTSKKEAGKYAGKLINCLEVFMNEGYGEVPRDSRKDPPDNGTVIEVIDEEGERQVVKIRKYNGGESADSSSENEDDYDQ